MATATQIELGGLPAQTGRIAESVSDNQNRLASVHSRVTQSEPVAASRRRGPSLARRTYHAGTVFQKGRTKSDRWDETLPSYGRYWKEVPGSIPRRIVVFLGVRMTRSLADRECADHIRKLGISSERRFIEATSTVTFKRQGETWLRTLANRKRNPIEQSTIGGMRSTSGFTHFSAMPISLM